MLKILFIKDCGQERLTPCLTTLNGNIAWWMSFPIPIVDVRGLRCVGSKKVVIY